MMHDAFQSCRPARSDRQSAVKALGEDLPPTMSDLTRKPPSDDPEAHRPTGAGQIRDLPGVTDYEFGVMLSHTMGT
jgi:hypothetical protein